MYSHRVPLLTSHLKTIVDGLYETASAQGGTDASCLISLARGNPDLWLQLYERDDMGAIRDTLLKALPEMGPLLDGFVPHIPALVAAVGVGGDDESPAVRAADCLSELAAGGNAEVGAAMTQEVCAGLEKTKRGKRVLEEIVEARRARGISGTGAGAGAGAGAGGS